MVQALLNWPGVAEPVLDTIRALISEKVRAVSNSVVSQEFTRKRATICTKVSALEQNRATRSSGAAVDEAAAAGEGLEEAVTGSEVAAHRSESMGMAAAPASGSEVVAHGSGMTAAPASGSKVVAHGTGMTAAPGPEEEGLAAVVSLAPEKDPGAADAATADEGAAAVEDAGEADAVALRRRAFLARAARKRRASSAESEDSIQEENKRREETK